MINIPNKLRKVILYDSPIIETPLNKSVKITFADITASGRPSPIIEKYIQNNVLPYYSNTHSNAYCGILMKNMVKEAKGIIRKELNIGKEKKIIFTGSGMTGAINHLIGCLNINKLPTTHIFTSSFEHHSNYLPWIELAKVRYNVKFYTIPIDENHDIDLDWLKDQLYKINDEDSEHICIVSVTACSNVTGIQTPIDPLWNLIEESNKRCKRECKYIKSNLLFLDYACSAPYVDIDSDKCDALFFSPHKFLGGVSTPGILVASKTLFLNTTPYEPGGGCVKKVCSAGVIYSADIEVKESAGTPNIIGIIRIGRIMLLKNILQPFIHNETVITKYVHKRFSQLSKKYDNFKFLLPNQKLERRLPIICISIDDLHYNFIVVLLNDLFGIQTRGGVSCTGILAEWIETKYGMRGWCRITLSWLMDYQEIDFIIKSVEFIIKNGKNYLNKYIFNKESNLFSYSY